MKLLYQKFTRSKWMEWTVLAGILALFAFLYFHVNTQGTYILQDYRQGSYYSQLGHLFEKGEIGLESTVGGDWAHVNGKYYLYHGPFPALVWLFFKTYLREFTMSFLTLAALVVNLLLFYLVSRKISFTAEFNEKKALVARFIFLILYGLGIPYFLAGKLFVYETSITFGSTFLLAAVLVFFNYLLRETDKKNLIQDGILLAVSALLIAFAFLSRINLILSFVPFLGAFVWKEWLLNKEKVRDFVSSWFLLTCFIIPIGIALVSFGFYNVARFGNPADFGVNHLTTSSDEDNMRLKSGKATSIHYGLLNLLHATVLLPVFDTKPSYINYSAPQWMVGSFPRLVNVEYGGSLFFSSPFLLFILAVPFFLKKYNKKTKSILVFLVALIFSVATYSYFFMGFARRYHQDYYPFLMLIAFLGFYLFWQNVIQKQSKALRVFFWILAVIVLIWTTFLAVHLNCIHTYYGHFDRCLDIKQPIQWYQPLS